MAYMYVCPECRSYFKAKSSGKNIKCPKCSHLYLIDLYMDDEAWGTLTSVEKKTIANARISEEAVGEDTPAAKETAGPEGKPVKKVVKKVVKKRVVKKVVVKTPAETVKEQAPAPEEKEETKPETKEETAEQKKEPVEQKKEPVEQKKEPDEQKEEIKEENKASSGAGNILASILKGIKDKEKGPEEEEKKEVSKDEASSEEEAANGPVEKDEASENGGQKIPQKPEKPEINRKYVIIVAATTAVLFIYLFTVTFIIPSFRIKKELPALRSAVTGDTVQFGKYKGQNEWIVLDKKGSNILCMSNYPIDGHAYYEEGWDNSSLRKWFNSVYINSSFNVFERMRVKSTKEIQKEYPDYTRELEADSPDKVFIISEDELIRYLKSYRDTVLDVNDGQTRAVCWIEID